MSEQTNSGAVSAVYGRCVEVTKKHLDVWNHTNNICYVQWMQDVATEHSAVLGWDSKRYLEAGAIWVVRNHTIDYFRSTYEGDKILIQTWIEEMKRASCIRRYRFLILPKDCNLDIVEKECQWASYEDFSFPKSALAASAMTHWAFVSTDNYRPMKVFSELNAVFEQKTNNAARFPE